MRSASISPIISDLSKTPAHVVICEQIDEVLTTYEDDGTISEEVESNASTYSLPEISLKDLPCKVYFPEFGIDMVDMNAPTFDPFPCDITNPRISWEDNWLFRKQMEAMAIKTSRPQPQQPVSMLVPNPVEIVKPRIGNKDFDLVSELSEQQSVVSFDVSSSDSDDEVNNGEHASQKSLCDESEKDQEYTIYDMIPIQ